MGMGLQDGNGEAGQGWEGRTRTWIQDGDGNTGWGWGYRMGMGRQDGNGETGQGWEYRTGMRRRMGMGRQDWDGETGRGWEDRTGMGKKDWDGEAGPERCCFVPPEGLPYTLGPRAEGCYCWEWVLKCLWLSSPHSFCYLEDAGFVTTTKTQSHQQSALCEQKFLSSAEGNSSSPQSRQNAFLTDTSYSAWEQFNQKSE